MGDFSPEITPQHFDGIELGAVGRQIQQNKSTGSSTYLRFDFIILMSIGIIPSHIDGVIGLFLKECFQKFGDFLGTFAFAYQNYRFT